MADAYDTTNVTASPSYKSPLAALYDEIMSELPHPDVRPIRDPNGDIMMVTLTAGFDQILNVVSCILLLPIGFGSRYYYALRRNALLKEFS